MTRPLSQSPNDEWEEPDPRSASLGKSSALEPADDSPVIRTRSSDWGRRALPRERVGPTRDVDPRERSLIDRIRAGDEAAFEMVFHAQYQTLWAIAMIYVRSPEVAKECVQDVLLRIWEHRARLPVRDNLRGYLTQAVRHHALNHRRSQQVNERWEQQAVHDLRVSGMGEGPRPTDDRAMTADLTAAVCRAVEQVPPRKRQAFQLRWQGGLTNAEIAKRMGVTVKCVEIHLSHALKVVRIALTEYLRP
jgi:RNA polymerase sigma-70 factor (family 1)